MQIYFILFNIYYDFLHMILHPLSLPACPLFERRNLVIVRPSNIIFAPKPCIYYQNINILPKEIHMNIQIYLFPHFKFTDISLLSIVRHFVAFLQTNLDRFFWKILTFYYFQSNYSLKIIFRSGNHPHNQ